MGCAPEEGLLAAKPALDPEEGLRGPLALEENGAKLTMPITLLKSGSWPTNINAVAIERSRKSGASCSVLKPGANRLSVISLSSRPSCCATLWAVW